MPPKKSNDKSKATSSKPEPRQKANLIGDAPTELFIQCKNLTNKDTLVAGDKSDAFVVVHYRNQPGGKWTQVGRTEVVDDDLNPKFSKTFMFQPDPTLELRFEVFDEDPTKNELIGVGSCFFKELSEKINTEVSKPLKIDKTGRQTGEILLTARANAENLAVLQERAKIVSDAGFDLEREEDEKDKVSEEIRTYVESSGLPMAFKLICVEIVEKKIEKEEVYPYAVRRMREIGEQITKLVRNSQIHYISKSKICKRNRKPESKSNNNKKEDKSIKRLKVNSQTFFVY